MHGTSHCSTAQAQFVLCYFSFIDIGPCQPFNDATGHTVTCTLYNWLTCRIHSVKPLWVGTVCTWQHLWLRPTPQEMTSTDSDALPRAVETVNELVEEAVVRSQLFSHPRELQSETTILLKISSTLKLYRLLLQSVPLDASTDSPTFQLLSPAVPSAHSTPVIFTQLLEAFHQTSGHASRLLDALKNLPFCLTLVEDDSVWTPHAETVKHATKTLADYFPTLENTFRTFWSTQNHPKLLLPEIVGASEDAGASLQHAFRISPFAIEVSQMDSLAPSRWHSLITSPESLDAVLTNVAADAKSWAEAMIQTRNSHEVQAIIAEALWSGPVVGSLADLTRIHRELTTRPADGFPAGDHLLHTLQIYLTRSRSSRNLVLPYGRSPCGKDTLINGLIGSNVLPRGGKPDLWLFQIKLTPPQFQPPALVEYGTNLARKTRP